MDTFSQLVSEYSEQVYNHALRLLKNREDAEEATQDVFLKISKALHLFRGDAKLSTWIWRITTNVCYTRLSKKKIESKPLDDALIDTADHQTLFETLTDHDRREAIQSALKEIPPQQASILLLFYFEELSYKEISDVFNLPEGTIATLLYRGRENLRKVLSKSYKEFYDK